MHNHSPEKGDSWMMWVMMICCAIPLILILIFGFGGKVLGTPNWVVLAGVGGMALLHFLMMRKSHGSHENKRGVDDSNTNKVNDNDNDNDNSSGHNYH